MHLSGAFGFEHGVLTLTLAKLEPQSKAVTLNIE
jgi:HSP20 family molecular chaperone IbpA